MNFDVSFPVEFVPESEAAFPRRENTFKYKRYFAGQISYLIPIGEYVDLNVFI
jgi:hypothetical protein